MIRIPWLIFFPAKKSLWCFELGLLSKQSSNLINNLVVENSKKNLYDLNYYPKAILFLDSNDDITLSNAHLPKNGEFFKKSKKFHVFRWLHILKYIAIA